MKKGILAILTVLTVFALVLTGCPSPGTPKPNSSTLYTVTFDGNENTGGTAPKAIKQKTEGEEIKLPAKGTLAKSGFTFGGWSDEDDEVYAAGDMYTPEDDVTLYAVWTPAGSGGTFTVTFNANGGSGTQAPITQPTANAPITLPTAANTTLTAPTGKSLDGWSLTATGAKLGTATYTPTANTELFAVWKDGEGPGPQPTGLIEKVTLSNASQVVYRFDLPNNKKWSDYAGVSADYMIDDAAIFDAENSGRAMRLYGNYAMDFFQFNTTNAGTKYAYASLDGDANNNAYILDDTGSGGWKTLSAALIAELGECPDVGQWFTINYKTDGSRSNKKPHPHLPADADTGPFIFGLGLPGQGGTNTFYITNVLLKGKDSTTENLVGKPLFISKDNYNYPAFSAYGTVEGDNGEDNLSRTATQGTYPPAWPAVAPPTVTVTFDLNKPEGVAAEPAFVDSFTGTKSFNKDSAVGTLPSATLTGYTFSGWAETAAGTVAIAATKTYSADARVYAIWLAEGTSNTITFNLAGGTSATGKAPITFAKGDTKKLVKAELAKGDLTNTGKVFGGWYTTDTTAGTFNYNDYTKLVSTNTGFTADATLWAFWYDAPSITTPGTLDGVYGNGGGRIDKDGYVIFVPDTHSYLGGGYDGDTLLTFKFATDNTTWTKIKINYEFKAIVQPALYVVEEETWVLDAAGITKKGFNSFSTTISGSGNYFSFNAAGGILEYTDTQFKTDNVFVDGLGWQINKGDDNANGTPFKQRVGYVFGIKITSVEYE
jgi:uncharacterized repeat protein (TIGR02543 family)